MATKTNKKSNVVVTGTDKADFITSIGKNVTVNGGAGNDHIDN